MPKQTAIAFSALIALGVSTGSAAVVEHFDYGAFAASAGPQTVVNFDGQAEGADLNGATLSGVHFSARRITVVNPQDFAPGLTGGGANLNSQPHGISASLAYSTPNLITFDNLDDNFVLTLVAPRPSAGLWLGNIGAFDGDLVTPTVVTFFGAGNSVLASETIQQGHAGMLGSGVNNRTFYGLVSDSVITRVEVQNAAADGDGILLDDVQFSSVPESTAASLMTLAALTIAATRSRRR
jgi:hypothetical protein